MDPDYQPDFGEYHYRPRGWQKALDDDDWVTPISVSPTADDDDDD